MESGLGTVKANWGHRLESNTYQEKQKAPPHPRIPIVKVRNLDEERELDGKKKRIEESILERKKRRAEKRKARRARQKETREKYKATSVQRKADGKPLTTVAKDKLDDEMKPTAQQFSKTAKTDNITYHNVQVAATGLFAYIAIDSKIAERTMDDWVDATIFALSNSLRPAATVSYLVQPKADSSIRKKTKAPLALIARFRTEEELQRALGPITIRGFNTEVVRYRGGKGCTFKIPLGTWALEEEKLLHAFEMQAIAEVRAWGWRQLYGTKTHLVLQSVLPPGRNKFDEFGFFYMSDYEYIYGEVIA
ncbi:hypothetical protein HOY82DRAFT_617277 [Tuber indicum]|nr:hypothetical protein HOY82DRAFT_617277 [Tuber indicum]